MAVARSSVFQRRVADGSRVLRSLLFAPVDVNAAVGRVEIVLLERDRELDLMAELLVGVGSSGGKVVLVRGEAGIGKGW